MTAAILLLGLGWAGIYPSSYALHWDAPSSCPAEAEVVALVDAMLVDRPAHEVFVTVDAVVEAKDEGFELELRIATDSGNRSRAIEASECDELANVAALLVAIAVDPGLAHGASTVVEEPSPPVEPERPVKPEPPTDSQASEEPPEVAIELEPPAEPQPSTPEPRPRGTRSALSAVLVAGAGLSVGVLPSVGPIVRLGGGLRWRSLYFEVSGLHRVQRWVGSDMGRAELWTLAADARGCGMPGWSKLEFPLCLGVEAGTIAGRSFDITAPARGHAPWVATVVGGGLSVLLGRRLAIALGIDLLVPVVRAGFVIEGLGELYRVGSVAMDSSISLQVKLP